MKFIEGIHDLIIKFVVFCIEYLDLHDRCCFGPLKAQRLKYQLFISFDIMVFVLKSKVIIRQVKTYIFFL